MNRLCKEHNKARVKLDEAANKLREEYEKVRAKHNKMAKKANRAALDCEKYGAKAYKLMEKAKKLKRELGEEEPGYLVYSDDMMMGRRYDTYEYGQRHFWHCDWIVSKIELVDPEWVGCTHYFINGFRHEDPHFSER